MQEFNQTLTNIGKRGHCFSRLWIYNHKKCFDNHKKCLGCNQDKIFLLGCNQRNRVLVIRLMPIFHTAILLYDKKQCAILAIAQRPYTPHNVSPLLSKRSHLSCPKNVCHTFQFGPKMNEISNRKRLNLVKHLAFGSLKIPSEVFPSYLVKAKKAIMQCPLCSLISCNFLTLSMTLL